MKHHDERPRMDQEDKEFAARLAAHYAPPPWASAKRVGFDEALRARIERPRWRGFLIPALATAAAAALVWISFSVRPAGEESNPVAASVWGNELFLSSDVSPLDDRDDGEGLPEDYLAIASLFLDG
jgi:hypothetical protein